MDAFTDTEYADKTYHVPVTGRDENLNAMLTDVPDDEHAMAFLMQDGNLGVPGGRYGSYTRTCAPIALALTKIMQEHSGDAMTYYQLDADMGLVVNSHDDVAYMVREYAETVGLNPSDLLNDDEFGDEEGDE